MDNFLEMLIFVAELQGKIGGQKDLLSIKIRTSRAKEKIYMDFGKRLYELRKQKGLSQEELANQLNVTRQTVSKWELGDSSPDVEKLIALGDLFAISLDEMVLGKVPAATRLDKLEEKIMTEENKQKAKKGIKILGIIAGAVFAVDLLSMILYVLFRGFPK